MEEYKLYVSVNGIPKSAHLKRTLAKYSDNAVAQYLRDAVRGSELESEPSPKLAALARGELAAGRSSSVRLAASSSKAVAAASSKTGRKHG